ncbi:hypothetical protein CFB39_32035 [Burkholderia sp. AU6039]|nr:hypothetical protein CFB39_32035 [Burkholderia sp. AU6039]
MRIKARGALSRDGDQRFARLTNTMGFGLQRVWPVAPQAGWFMRIKRATAGRRDLAIRGAVNTTLRRVGVMPEWV